jgi:hypothetical protein
MSKHTYFALDSDVLRNLSNIEDYITNHPDCTKREIIRAIIQNDKFSPMYKNLDVYLDLLELIKKEDSQVRLLVTTTPSCETCSIQNVQKFIKPLICADEMINGGERWCLWLYNQQKSEYEKSLFITNRIKQLREIRLKSSRPQLAEVSHLFAQITQPMNCNYIVIPCHSSENRVYIPIDYKVDNSIAHNS